MARSASTVITRLTRLASSLVRMPSPGPTSTTVSSGANSAADTIRCNTRPSTRKCCPRLLRARSPSWLIRRLVSAASDLVIPLRPIKKRVVHPLLTLPSGLSLSGSSDQESLWHPDAATYRCFLPDLTGFVVFCRTGPGPQRHPTEPVPQGYKPQVGIQPRFSGFRVQGTASSPPSTTQAHGKPARCRLSMQSQCKEQIVHVPVSGTYNRRVQPSAVHRSLHCLPQEHPPDILHIERPAVAAQYSPWFVLEQLPDALPQCLPIPDPHRRGRPGP